MIPIDESAQNDFLDYVFNHYHYDFRGYSTQSIRRRLTSAMIWHRVASLGQLRYALAKNPLLFKSIFPFLTVTTTELFRNPEFFRSVRNEIFPHLKRKQNFRIWVAGCSTGEEVYSYSILLHEAGLLDRCAIYATDIHRENLNRARSGIFSLDKYELYAKNFSSATNQPSKKMNKYFSVSAREARFQPSFLENVCFYDHSLASDESFAEFHFISCRNVLIYFDQSLRCRAMSLFDHSLAPQGYIAFGKNETLHSHALLDGTYAQPKLGQPIYRRLL